MSHPPSTLPAPWFYGLAAVAAPVLLLMSDVAYVTAGGGVNDGVLGGTIGVWSCFVFLIAFVGISRSIEALAPRAATALLALAVPAFVAGAGFNVQAIHLGHFGQDFMSSVSEGADLVGLLAFLPWGWFGPLTFVVAGVLVWRTGVFPASSGALLVAGGILFISGRPARIEALVMASDVVLVLAMASIGLALLAGAGRSARSRETEPVLH
jgi:hypothetical protein